MTDRLVSGAPLLRLSEQERRGMEWLRQRAGLWIVALRRRRKRLPPGGYSEEEILVLRALVTLEEAAGQLLSISPCPGVMLPGTRRASKLSHLCFRRS